MTFACLIVGTLALTGCPGFSGYFSKDLIIAWAVVEKPILGWIAVATAGLTAFYMFRLLAVVFLGPLPKRGLPSMPTSRRVMIILSFSSQSRHSGPVMRRSSRCFFTSRSPSTCLRHYALLALFVLGGGLAWSSIGNRERPDSFRSLPSGFTSTISTTGWSEPVGRFGDAKRLG